MRFKSSKPQFISGMGVGILIGLLAVAIVWSRHVLPARRDVADLYVAGVERNIRTCELIRAGDTNAARRMLENDLLVTSRGIQGIFSDQPGADYFLYRIARYFDQAGRDYTGRYTNNLADLRRVSVEFPSNSNPLIYYFQASPSYLESLIQHKVER